jgi:hypothetical protein
MSVNNTNRRRMVKLERQWAGSAANNVFYPPKGGRSYCFVPKTAFEIQETR